MDDSRDRVQNALLYAQWAAAHDLGFRLLLLSHSPERYKSIFQNEVVQRRAKGSKLYWCAVGTAYWRGGDKLEKKALCLSFWVWVAAGRPDGFEQAYIGVLWARVEDLRSRDGPAFQKLLAESFGDAPTYNDIFKAAVADFVAAHLADVDIKPAKSG